jgi:hypothetical protein
MNPFSASRVLDYQEGSPHNVENPLMSPSGKKQMKSFSKSNSGVKRTPLAPLTPSVNQSTISETHPGLKEKVREL